MSCGNITSGITSGLTGGLSDLFTGDIGGAATLGASDVLGLTGGTSSGGGGGGLESQYLALMQDYAAGLPTQVALQEQYQPTFTNLDLQNQEQYLAGTPATATSPAVPGYLDLYANQVVPTITGATNAANTATRTAQQQDLTNLGPGTLAAIQGANPGQTALMNSLTKTATNQLNLGTQIDPTQLAQINAATNANWAGRGLGTSNPAQLDAALQYYGGGQQLLGQRETAAGQVSTLNQNEYTDPLLSMVGLTSGAAAQGQNLTATGTAGASSASPTVFSPADATSLFSAQFNANNNASIDAANNKAALCASGISAGGSIIGGGLGAI